MGIVIYIIFVTCYVGTRLSAIEFEPLRTCDDGWHLFQSSCFSVVDLQKSWSEAQKYCHSLGGILAEPRTLDAINYLHDLLRNFLVSELWLWLGGRRDPSNDARWIWSSNNEEIKIKIWGRGEPNNGKGNEDCLHALEYTWNDEACAGSYNFSCQRRPRFTNTIIYADEYEPIFLQCPIRSLATTRIRWTKTLEVNIEDTFDSILDTNSSTLVIQSIRWYDYGIYVCQAESYFENISYVFDVNVVTKFNSSIIYTTEGESINVQCPIGIKFVYTVNWTKTDFGIEKSIPASTSMVGNVTTSYMVIDPIKWTDGGIYECHASSGSHSVSYRYVINVNTSSGMCPCSCDYKKKLIFWAENILPNRTKEELMEILEPVLQKLKEELSVPKKAYSSYKRTLTSTMDARKSSQVIGSIGIIICGIFIGVIVCADVISFINFLQKYFKINSISPKGQRKGKDTDYHKY